MSFEQLLAAHLFEPQTWVARAKGNLALARHYQQKAAPLSQFANQDWDSFAARVILLPSAQLEVLGFACALTPFIGTIGTNLNGRMRRALKGYLSAEQVASLDSLPLVGNQFLLGQKDWDNPCAIAHAGLASAIACLPLGPQQQSAWELRVDLPSPAVSCLTATLVEDLCKILLPTQAWLFQETTSQ
jgi:hypothetical protein